MNTLLAKDMEETESFITLLQSGEEIAAEVKERFKIKGLQEATWATRKLANLEAKEREIMAVVNAEIQRINDWKESEMKGLKSSREFFIFLLEEYHREKFALDDKQKTIKTPYGELCLRTQQDEYEYDEDKLRAYAEANRPEVLEEVPKKILWGELKKTLGKVKQGEGYIAVDTTTGEPIPEITIKEREPKFSVKIKGE